MIKYSSVISWHKSLSKIGMVLCVPIGLVGAVIINVVALLIKSCLACIGIFTMCAVVVSQKKPEITYKEIPAYVWKGLGETWETL